MKFIVKFDIKSIDVIDMSTMMFLKHIFINLKICELTNWIIM
jgi:hypothetical protein